MSLDSEILMNLFEKKKRKATWLFMEQLLDT